MCTCKHVCLFHRFSVRLCQRHWCSLVEASFNAGMRSRKAFKSPYRSASDFQLKVFSFVFTNKNTQALRVVNFFVGPVKGNCHGSRTEMKIDMDKENKRLPKQRYSTSV